MWSAFKLYMSKVWAWIKPAVMVILSELGRKALAIAIDVVQEVALKDMTSDEKRSEAFEMIKTKLEEQGKEAGTSLINLAIELAVQRLKSLQ